MWAALFSAIALDTMAELCWKTGVNSAHSDSLLQTLLHTLPQPFFWVAMLLFIPKYFNWMYVLNKVDLNFAKPITSLGYIAVLAASLLLLHEAITWSKLVGVALILVGVWMVGDTDSHTAPGEAA